MKCVGVILFLFCSFLSVFGQQKMLILNEKSRKLCVINEKQWVKFQLDSIKIHRSRRVQGYLLSLNDSAAKLVVVRSFFHHPAIDTVFIPVKNIKGAGLYKPINEPLMLIGNSLVWAGATVLVTSTLGGGLLTFALVGLVATPFSMLSEYGLKNAFFPVYPLKGAKWHRVTDKQLQQFLSKPLL